MGNSQGAGSSSSPDDDFTTITKPDKLVTPICLLDKGSLQKEWSQFLAMPFFNTQLVAKLAKSKSKYRWHILCKFQRSLARRISEDAAVVENMNLILEAIALCHIAIFIHEVVSNVNIADTEYAMCKARLKLLEKRREQTIHRIEGPIPDESVIVISLDEFLSCSLLIGPIRDAIRTASLEDKWHMCLHFEFKAAAQIAQDHADRALELNFLNASKELYRCSMHLFKSDPLVEALKAVSDEIDYQEFSDRIHKRTVVGNVPTDQIIMVQRRYNSAMDRFPHVIREDMRNISPEGMRAMLEFLSFLQESEETLEANRSVIIAHAGHKSNASIVIANMSQIEDTSSTSDPVVKFLNEDIPMQPIAEIDSAGSNLGAGTPNTTVKASSKIAALQARLNLNPGMFMAPQQPKALALKSKPREFKSNDKGLEESTSTGPVPAKVVATPPGKYTTSPMVDSTPVQITDPMTHRNMDLPPRPARRRPKASGMVPDPDR